MKRIDWKDEKKKAFWKNIFIFRWDKLIQKRDIGKWVFGGREGNNFDDNSRYFFEWINTHHPEIDSAWLCKSSELASKIRNMGYKAYAFGTKEADDFAKHAGVAFYSHGLMDFGLNPRVGGAKIVTAWHGCGFKKVYRLSHKGLSLWLKILADSLFSWTYRDLTMGTSKEHLRHAIGNMGLSKNAQMVICGQPRNDVLFSGITKEEVLLELGINPQKNIILYMPTYRGPAMGEKAMSNIVLGLYNCKELDDALKQNNSIFVVKLHPLTPHINIENRENFKILDYGAVKDNQKLLSVGDMMISDYSATIVDFALLERPILFYMPDHEKFIQYSESLFDEIFKICKYDSCRYPEELAERIFHPSKFAVNALNELYEDPSIKGTCYCENVYNAIKERYYD